MRAYLLLFMPVIALLAANYKTGPIGDFAPVLILSIVLALAGCVLFVQYTKYMIAHAGQWILGNLASEPVQAASASFAAAPGLPRLRLADRMIAQNGSTPRDIISDPQALHLYRYVAGSAAAGVAALPPMVTLFFVRLPMIALAITVAVPVVMMLLPPQATPWLGEMLRARSAWMFAGLTPLSLIIGFQYLHRSIIEKSHELAVRTLVEQGKLDASVLDGEAEE